MLLFVCVNCKRQSSACPQCVNTIRIDPETNLPPDVVRLTPWKFGYQTPDPAAVKRSTKEPVCDDCISTRDDVLTSVERHRRFHQNEDYLD